ncbi:Rieske [2Fe-2S] iron-sulfur domain-containing protein [Aspergillus aurantiobrunneus]
MLAAIQNRFTSTDKAQNGAGKPVLEGNLPASWYTEPLFYELQRRAIFSKHWLLTTHRLRLPEAGSYLRFEIAGFDLLLIKNKEGRIQAFHNVCRRRAYPLIDKDAPDQGKKSILSCEYYGLSYNLDGKLTKAPKFDDLDGFDAAEYSLFKTRTHVDKTGFVWERLNDFSLDEYVYYRTWTTNRRYNWKVVGENYNECYHCKPSHPGITKITNLDRYSAAPYSGRFEHFPRNRADIKPQDFDYFGNGAFTYNFPNPASPQDVFDRAAAFFEGIELEDYDLCNGVQKNLNAGVYVHGPLHASREGGVLYFKNLVQGKLRGGAVCEGCLCLWDEEEGEVVSSRSQLPRRRTSSAGHPNQPSNMACLPSPRLCSASSSAWLMNSINASRSLQCFSHLK